METRSRTLRQVAGYLHKGEGYDGISFYPLLRSGTYHRRTWKRRGRVGRASPSRRCRRRPPLQASTPHTRTHHVLHMRTHRSPDSL